MRLDDDGYCRECRTKHGPWGHETVTLSTCKRCGFTTDNTMAMREHILRQQRGYDPCKPRTKGQDDDRP